MDLNEIETHACGLVCNGYVVLPVDAESHRRAAGLYAEWSQHVPEFGGGGEAHAPYVPPGGFAAVNLPSAFYHPCSDCADQAVLAVAGAVLARVGADVGMRERVVQASGVARLLPDGSAEPPQVALPYGQVIHDRWMHRVKGKKPGQQSWHVDVNPGVGAESQVFGGFLNVNTGVGESQYMVVKPRSHVFGSAQACAHSEFTPLWMLGGPCSKEERAARQRELTRECDAAAVRVEVRPGEVFLMYENLLHKVNGEAYKYDITRKFFGYCLSKEARQWVGEQGKRGQAGVSNAQRASLQLAPAHKGGKVADLFPQMYLCNHVAKLVEYSAPFVDGCCSQHTFAAGSKKAGQTVRIVKRKGYSLVELGLGYDAAATARAQQRFEVRALAQAAYAAVHASWWPQEQYLEASCAGLRAGMLTREGVCRTCAARAQCGVRYAAGTQVPAGHYLTMHICAMVLLP